MTERPKSADAFHRAHNENLKRRVALSNARRNEIARREKVYHGEWTAEENLAIQRDLKAAFLARHPELAA